jgi:hypothetical protein
MSSCAPNSIPFRRVQVSIAQLPLHEWRRNPLDRERGGAGVAQAVGVNRLLDPHLLGAAREKPSDRVRLERPAVEGAEVGAGVSLACAIARQSDRQTSSHVVLHFHCVLLSTKSDPIPLTDSRSGTIPLRELYPAFAYLSIAASVGRGLVVKLQDIIC